MPPGPPPRPPGPSPPNPRGAIAPAGPPPGPPAFGPAFCQSSAPSKFQRRTLIWFSPQRGSVPGHVASTGEGVTGR
eukprot:3568560-Rhodomonas_salina.2